MNEDKREFIEQWLYKANEDFMAAKELLKSELPLTGVICFHCQQSIEKYLKAYLIYKDEEVEKTHHLESLMKRSAEHDAEFNGIELSDIDQFAVTVRYADDFFIPSDSDAKEYFRIAGLVKELVSGKIIFK